MKLCERRLEAKIGDRLELCLCPEGMSQDPKMGVKNLAAAAVAANLNPLLRIPELDASFADASSQISTEARQTGYITL
jgi:hypothetical protein